MADTKRDAMMRALAGEPCERIPWAPRMDLWYIALRERGALPAGLEEADIVDIARHYRFGCHAVRCDATRSTDPDAAMFRGLGYENHPDYPYRIELDGLPSTYRVTDGVATTTVETSSGSLCFSQKSTPSMRRDGISQPFKLRYPVEEPEDLSRVAELFEHLSVVPTPEHYAAFRDRIGDDGIAVAQGSISASPIHLLLHELMPMDRFYIWYYERYDELEAFAERITPFFQRILEAVAGAGAGSVLWGANFDRDLTWPPFFDREIAPWLIRVRDRLHEAGSLLVCHADGENSKLFDSYRNVRFDVAESVCAAPMTELDLLTQRRGYGDGVTIWGGIPSVLLLPGSVGAGEFDAHLEKLGREIEALAPGRSRLILGVSDNVPPDCDLSRLAAVGEWVGSL